MYCIVLIVSVFTLSESSSLGFLPNGVGEIFSYFSKTGRS